MEPQRFRLADGSHGGNNSPASSGVSHSAYSRNKILSSLTEPSLNRLMPQLELVSYETGEEVIKADQLIEFLYFPETLVVSQFCYLKDGWSAALSLIGHEGLLGVTALLNGGRAKHRAIASFQGTARRISVANFQAEFQRNFLLEELVLAYLSDRMLQLGQNSVCTMRHHLKERLCTWLMMVLDRVVSPTLPLTHETIAEHLGVRRAGVTTYVNTLKDRGILATKRAQLTVLDRTALEAFACECYQRVRLQAAGCVEPGQHSQ